MTSVIQKIVVPVDFSAGSERIVSYAAALARGMDARLYLMHVIPSDGPQPVTAWVPARVERRHDVAHARLAALAERLEGIAVILEVRSGVVAESIVEAVTVYGADLIVMGTHGRSGVPHLLFGSVAETVIRASRCPVLVMRDSGQVHVNRTSAA